MWIEVTNAGGLWEVGDKNEMHIQKKRSFSFLILETEGTVKR